MTLHHFNSSDRFKTEIQKLMLPTFSKITRAKQCYMSSHNLISSPIFIPELDPPPPYPNNPQNH